MIPTDVYRTIMSFMNIHDKIELARTSRNVSRAHNMAPIEYIYSLYKEQETIQHDFRQELKDIFRLHKTSDSIQSLVYKGALLNDFVTVGIVFSYQSSILSYILCHDERDDQFCQYILKKTKWQEQLEHAFQYYDTYSFSSEQQPLRIVSMLLKHGLNPSYCFKNGTTLLSMTIAKEHFSISKRLIEAGANIDFVNPNGDTIFIELLRLYQYFPRMRDDCIDILQMILKKKPKTLNMIINTYDETPLDYSRYFHNNDVYELLLRHGAKSGMKSHMLELGFTIGSAMVVGAFLGKVCNTIEVFNTIDVSRKIFK
jgi:hypothetical protein